MEIRPHAQADPDKPAIILHPSGTTVSFGELEMRANRRELLDWLRERLAHYKCPRSIAFEVQLPRTDTGKLYKQELVKKYSLP